MSTHGALVLVARQVQLRVTLDKADNETAVGNVKDLHCFLHLANDLLPLREFVALFHHDQRLNLRQDKKVVW